MFELDALWQAEAVKTDIEREAYPVVSPLRRAILSIKRAVLPHEVMDGELVHNKTY